ncbi:MAG: 3-carboxy-cis,cis-muconate cycloisomerase [Albidovulum sp.]|nr:3-carboxy-cis,cis-muconate cycloisomerase [Albidovulum sp.]
MPGASYDMGLFEFLRRDEFVAREFSETAMISRMIEFEKHLAAALGAVGAVPKSEISAALRKLADFAPDTKLIRECTERDGVPVPELVRQLRAAAGAQFGTGLHLGATSQDLIDTALVLALKNVNAYFLSRLNRLGGAFERLSAEFGDVEVMARTRMQNAEPMLARFRIESWRRPLDSHRKRLESLGPQLERLQFGGPTGDRSRLGSRADDVARILADALGLCEPGHGWHSERDSLAEYASWNSALAGILGKFGQDVALMAQMGEVRLLNAGGSSSMPHKSNPIKAELLVSLARFNATLVSGFHQALVHEQERSGAAWMLEWMVLPQACAVSGASLVGAESLANSIAEFGAESKR